MNGTRYGALLGRSHVFFLFFLFDECESALEGGERDQEGRWGGRGG